MTLSTWKLIRILARQHGHLPEFYRIALRDIVAEITRRLADGQSVHVAGLGTFTARTRSARKAWDFRSHTPIAIPARQHVTFRQSSSLASALAIKRPAPGETRQQAPSTSERRPNSS